MCEYYSKSSVNFLRKRLKKIIMRQFEGYVSFVQDES